MVVEMVPAMAGLYICLYHLVREPETTIDSEISNLKYTLTLKLSKKKSPMKISMVLNEEIYFLGPGLMFRGQSVSFQGK